MAALARVEHSVLQCPELVNLIADSAWDLLSLSRTRRQWFYSIITISGVFYKAISSRIWRELKSLAPLLNLIPQMNNSKVHFFCHKRTVRPVCVLILSQAPNQASQERRFQSVEIICTSCARYPSLLRNGRRP